MNSEVEIIDRKISREIKKLNDGIRLEIKKKLKKILPGLTVEITKINLDYFLQNRKRENPLEVIIKSLNGKKVHKNGFWVEKDEETGLLFKTDNKLSVQEIENICRELSESLDINVHFEKTYGKYQ